MYYYDQDTETYYDWIFFLDIRSRPETECNVYPFI